LSSVLIAVWTLFFWPYVGPAAADARGSPVPSTRRVGALERVVGEVGERSAVSASAGNGDADVAPDGDERWQAIGAAQVVGA
jgi:hypothetical protein